MARYQGVDLWVRGSLGCLLNDADFAVCQAVEFVDELVDLLVGRVELALDERLLVHQRIGEFVSGLGFVVRTGAIDIAVLLEPLDELLDVFWQAHFLTGVSILRSQSLTSNLPPSCQSTTV